MRTGTEIVNPCIDTPSESNINHLLKNICSHHIAIYFLLSIVCCQCVPSTCTQIVRQIEVIQELVLAEVSWLNNSVMKKKQGEQAQFSPEKKRL